MSRWEYRVIAYRGSGMDEWSMNQLGAEGWELVNLTYSDPSEPGYPAYSTTTYYFKRNMADAPSV